jgi:hypothetical protein
MASSCTATGTVWLWIDDDCWGDIHVSELPGDSSAAASVVEGLDEASPLRSGQTVGVDWTTPGPEDYDANAVGSCSAELQATLGNDVGAPPQHQVG